MTKRVGVLLSGCGVFDGSEIQEAVLTMLYLSRAGAKIICNAPDTEQYHVINHLTQEETAEGKRNVLLESARIARGEIVDTQQITADQLDALIIPGGFGAAKNLSDFALVGPEARVHPQVHRLINEMYTAGKPIGAMCIAPATLAKALFGRHPEVTIGTDVGTANAIETMGGIHHNCRVDQIHIDTANRVVTTPAYMLGNDIAEVAIGIEKLVNQVLEMIE